MERITTEELMNKLNMFKSIFGEIEEFVWWVLERILAHAGTQFTSKEFKVRIPNLWISFGVSITGTSGNEQTSRSDTENVEYNCTFSYGT